MLEASLERLIKAKHGNNEFALFHLGDGKWMAEIGNPSIWLMIGEVCGELRSEPRDTPLKAVNELLEQLTYTPPPQETFPWWTRARRTLGWR